MPKTISRLFLTAACMAMALSVQAYTFTKIADTNTAIPNGTGTFTGLSTAHISQSNIVFAAKGSSGQQGFYRWKDSVLTRLVDKNMTAPGFGTTFTNLPDYDSKFSEVNDFLFTGITAGGQGLYRWNSFNDTVDSLVDTTYNIPGLSEKFKTLRSLDQVQPPGRTVFVGYSSNFTEGIYFLSGTNITTLITTNDALPGTSATFLGTDNIVLDGAYAAFSPYRSDSSRGVYCYSYASNQIFAIADTNTVVPGKAIKFTGFTDPPTLHNGTVVFYGSYAGGAGLFSANADGTSLTKLVDTDMTTPSLTNKFNTLFAGYTYLNGRLLFYSSYFDQTAGRSRPGIYLLDNGVISTVVDTFTSLDGQTPANLGITQEAMDTSSNIVFMASFGTNAPFTPAVYTTMAVAASIPQFTLTTNVSPSGAGSIQLFPDSADGKYNSNSVVQLTATAVAGKAFAGWSGAVTGSVNPIDVTMSTNKSVTATFTNIPVAPNVTLTTNVSPAGFGSITVDPTGTSFPSNSVVTLTATPSEGKLFVRWTGASTATTNPVSLTMNGNKSITAVFTNAPQYYVLSTNVNPGDAGTIGASVAPTINGYAAGTAVTLTAAPKAGFKFLKWSGASAALTTKITLTMNANKTVTALFTNIPKFLLNVTLSPTDAGTVIKSPSAVTSNDFYTGTIVTLTPVAKTGFKFVKWTGALTGTIQPGKVTMNTNKSVTAVFTNVPTFQLTASVVPPGAGDILANLSQATNGYNSNAVVGLSTVANGTNTFALWTGAVSSYSNAVSVTMKTNKSVTAVFNAPGKIYWQSTNSVISHWHMQDSNYVASALLNGGRTIAKSWRLAGVIDFNNNGSKDLLFQNSSGAVMLWMMTNNFVVRTQVLKTAPLGIKLIGAGNFTTNTSPDLLWQNNTSGALTIWTFNGVTYTGSQNVTSSVPDTGWKALAVADFNNDGRADIVFQHTDGRVMLWFMNGVNMTNSVILNDGLAVTTDWKVAAVSDLDGNGTPDILFQIGTQSGVWELNGTNITSQSFIADGGVMAASWTLRAGK